MDIVGGGRVHVYPSSDELPHKPNDHENWQESFVLIWFDLEQNIGGFFRVGHEPNYNGGRAQFMSNIFSPEGIYHRSTELPLRKKDRFENGINNGEDTLRYEYDGSIRWILNDTDVSANLVVEEFVPAIDAHKRENDGDGDSAHDYTGNHVDAACGVTGELTVKGKTYKVNGLGIRDHGWGTRDWNSLLTHRWNLGTFDKDNSFVAMTFLTTTNQLVEFGWVIRNNQVIFADKVKVRAIIGHDGVTNFGGTTQMTLSTGEVLEATFEPLYPCVASWIHQTICYDSMCKVTWGDRVGFGVFETTSNIQGGTIKPTVYDGSLGPDGWY